MTETEEQAKDREYARSVFGNCDDGSVRPENASWKREVIPLDLLRPLYPDVDAWLKEEIEARIEESGEEPHWCDLIGASDFEAYLEEHTDGPCVISIDEDDTIQIWDGWHRVAIACVRGETAMTILVGRVLEPQPKLVM